MKKSNYNFVTLAELSISCWEFDSVKVIFGETKLSSGVLFSFMIELSATKVEDEHFSMFLASSTRSLIA